MFGLKSGWLSVLLLGPSICSGCAAPPDVHPFAGATQSLVFAVDSTATAMRKEISAFDATRAEEFQQEFVDVIVQGEGEHTFRELVERWVVQREHGDRTFAGVKGARYRSADGKYRLNGKREQTADLDTLAPPRRDLVKKYRGRYFFTGVRPMVEVMPLEKANEAYQKMKSGEVKFRMVLTMKRTR